MAGCNILPDSILPGPILPCPQVRSGPVDGARMRTVAAIAGRVLLGVLAAVLLGGAVLVLLAFYADLSFDVEAVIVAIVVAGVAVFLWTRWR